MEKCSIQGISRNHAQHFWGGWPITGYNQLLFFYWLPLMLSSEKAGYFTRQMQPLHWSSVLQAALGRPRMSLGSDKLVRTTSMQTGGIARKVRRGWIRHGRYDDSRISVSAEIPPLSLLLLSTCSSHRSTFCSGLSGLDNLDFRESSSFNTPVGKEGMTVCAYCQMHVLGCTEGNTQLTSVE